MKSSGQQSNIIVQNRPVNGSVPLFINMVNGRVLHDRVSLVKISTRVAYSVCSPGIICIVGDEDNALDT